MELQNIANQYNTQFRFNILPLSNKIPQGNWAKWQQDIMLQEDMNSFSWQNINGIGAVCGINDLRCLDFDNVNNADIIQHFLRSLGLPSEYTWTVLSGSGTGYHIWFYCMSDSYMIKKLGGEKSYYKFFLKTDNLCDHIELRWKNCQTVLPPSLHPSGKSYKFIHTNNIKGKPPSVIPIDRLVNALNQYCDIPQEKQPRRNNRKNNNIPDLARIKETADYLAGKVSDYDDWMRLGFALASIGEQGREYFLQISKNNPSYNDTDDELNNKFSRLLKDYRGDITIGSFYEIAKAYGYEKPAIFFWRVEDGKGKILSSKMMEFLSEQGFAKIIFNRGYMFIHDIANIVSVVTRISIKDFIIEFIKNNCTGSARGYVLEYLIRNLKVLCTDGTFECLPTIRPYFVTGTKVKEYFFFRNCYVEVTKDDVLQKEYSDLKGKIWESQIVKYDFQFITRRSVFQVFIENICRKDIDRINALRSALGYLLVSFKDPSCAKAVVFTDEKLSENSHGRSGKGIVSSAIGKMKNAMKIDGKNFSFDKSFMFQSVNPDTQLIIYDDIKKRFGFEKLFSILTDGMTVEKKNKDEFRLPYESSPKILITTNHTIEGTDDSSIDRQFVVEFSDYYNARFNPSDEFGHVFFNDWDNDEWNAFFNYMIDCCKYYLNNGLRKYKFVNLDRKKLIDNTAPEFEEFIKSLPLNEEYDKKELFDRFKEEYADFGNIRQGTLVKWMKVYADLYNIEITERKSGQNRYVLLSTKADENTAE